MEDVSLIGGATTEVREVDVSEVEALETALDRRRNSGAPQPRERSRKKSGTAGKTKVAPEPKPVRHKTAFVVTSDDQATLGAIRDVMKFLPGLIKARRQQRIEDEVRKLVDIVLPRDASDELARDIELENAELRREFIRAWKCLRSSDVHKLSGRRSTNAAQTASRWKAQGRIFAVPYGGNDLYPAFQFKDGEPRPVIARVLERFGDKLSPWQTAFWFGAESGWLDGRKPVDLIDSDPDAVAAAAETETAEALY
jgi:hypothetical protein